MEMELQFVRTDSELVRLAAVLSDLEAIGIDTEFVRTKTFHAQLGIVQIWDGSVCYIVEPDQISAWDPLTAVLAAPRPLKVLHSGSEDLEIFSHLLKAAIQGLFDTQIAGALTGSGGLLGYQPLVQQLLGVELEKGETRSNWLQRPLTDSQLRYAALDVFYLLDLHNMLAKKLEASGRSAWAQEEFIGLVDRSQGVTDPMFYYRRFGRRWQLKPQQRWLLLALCRWREESASRRDRPRNWVANDKTLFAVADAMPTTPQELEQATELSPKALRSLAAQWLPLVKQARSVAADDCPPPGHRPLTKLQRDRYKEIRGAVTSAAETLALPVDMVATRKDMEKLVRAEPDWSNVMQGWRKNVLQKPLAELLETQPA